MAACQLHRKNGTVEKVLAPNQKPSILYKDVLAFVAQEGADKLIQDIPYVKARLQEGSILNNSNEEVAVALWSMTYTNEFNGIFGNLPDFMKQRILDENGELKFDIFKDMTMTSGDYDKAFKGSVLSPEAAAFAGRQAKRGNALQQRILDIIHVNPTNPVKLEPVDHIYYDQDGNQYTSTTTAIKGKLHDPENKYEKNRKWGQAFDAILQGIIEHKTFNEIKDTITDIDDNIKRQAFNTLQAYITALTADGSIVVTQVVVSDKATKIAGSLDIMVISPRGKIKVIDLKVSKNSITKEAYANSKWDVGPESVIGGQLTTKQQHGIQVGVYKKLIELQGFEVASTETLHIKLDIENDAVTAFDFEGHESHSPSANKPNVDKVVSTTIPRLDKVKQIAKELGIDNPVNDPNFLTQEEAQPEINIPGDLYDKLTGKIAEIVDMFKLRKNYFEKLKDSVNFNESKAESIERINELLVMLNQELVDDEAGVLRGEESLAFGRFLNYTKDELTKVLHFTINPHNKKRDEYARVLIEADKFIESYRGLVNTQGILNENQRRMVTDVIELLNATQAAIDENLQEYVKGVVKSNTSRNLTEEELDSIMTEVLDIPLEDYNLGDMATSKDTLLAIVDKIVKNARQTALDNTDTLVERIHKLGSNLLKAAGVNKPDGKFYDFMKVMNKAGEFTGRYVTRVGQQYWDMYYNHKNRLKEKNGDTKKYINITDLATASAEDIAYNIQLFQDKKLQREFLTAEVLGDTSAADGKYHKYTDAFKAERDKFEQLNIFQNLDGTTWCRWDKKEGVSSEEYQKYRLKYYNEVDYTKAIKEQDGSFQGRVQQDTGWFVKGEYVEIKDIASDGTDLRDPKYVKLMNPVTALEKAQSEFYKGWSEIMEDSLEKLPPSVVRQMRGKVGRVRGGFIDNMKKSGDGMFKTVSKSMRNFFTADVYTDQRMVDETGMIASGIPISYVGKLQNEKRVAYLQEELKKLDEKKLNKSISQKDYLAEKKKLREWLRIEETKVSASEIESDLVNNLIAFTSMAENYHVMSAIENDLLAVQRIVENREYIQQDSLGRRLVQKGSRLTRGDEGKSVVKKKGDALVPKRMRKYMKMVFYNDEEMNRSTLAMVAKRVQNYTSLAGVGFNIFGGINNYVMGRINNNIETAGSLYYERPAAMRAAALYNKEYLPGVFAGMGKAAVDANQPGSYYVDKKPNSKYEAMVEKFRMVRKNQQDSGRVDPMSWAYMIQEGGEYNVQSKTGVAILMSKHLTHSTTGETLSVYDAFDFNPNTGELKLKDGYSLSDEERHKHTNYIYEVNKQIHGNYAWEDRMVIQEHWLGQLGAQFHKWVYPAYKVRFKKRYSDENLGDVEGRYVSVINFLAYVKESEGNFIEKLRSGWKNMDAIQIKNMYKNLAELGYIAASFAMYAVIRGLASGLDDDDETLKRWANFLQYQQTRQINELVTLMPVIGTKEQWQLVKSPLPALGTLKEFGEATLSTLALPFPPYDDAYFQRGVHKDQLKMTKEWKDAIPGLRILNKWDAYETVKSFYIK